MNKGINTGIKGIALLFLIGFFMGDMACTPDRSPEGGRGALKVVASIYPVFDLARQVGGSEVQAYLLLPGGASPHTFEPTPKEVKAFSQARIFFRIGAGLEFWAERLVKSAGNPNLLVVTLAEGIPLIQSREGHGHEHGQGREALKAGNPHLWLDPVLVRGMIPRLVNAFSSADPKNQVQYRKRGQALDQDLQVLDGEIRETVARFKIKAFVGFHPSWTYFARRYGLKETGYIQASPGRDPTPRELKRLIMEVKSLGQKALFAEPQLSPRAVQVLAEETKTKVLVLDPLGGPDLAGRDTYQGLMRYNLSIMAQALGA
jgi:zinc transport system substrate-binding protein